MINERFRLGNTRKKRAPSFDRQVRLSTASRDPTFYDISDVAWDGRVVRVLGKNVSNATFFDQTAKHAFQDDPGRSSSKNNKHDSCRTPSHVGYWTILDLYLMSPTKTICEALCAKLV